MGKYIQLTKPYLVVVTVFVLARFVLEVAGVKSEVTSEISLTRLLFVLPVFLGLRFAREKLGGFKDMLLANFVYCFWGIALVAVVTALDVALSLKTHYGFGPSGEAMPLGQHLFGHIIEIVVFTVVTSIITWITTRVASAGTGAAA